MFLRPSKTNKSSNSLTFSFLRPLLQSQDISEVTETAISADPGGILETATSDAGSGLSSAKDGISSAIAGVTSAAASTWSQWPDSSSFLVMLRAARSIP